MARYGWGEQGGLWNRGQTSGEILNARDKDRKPEMRQCI